jgi:hypothetical protein
MRSLSSRPSRYPWFVPLLLLVVGSFSCEDKHIGRVCELDVDGGPASGTTATVDIGLECPTRICLLPANMTGTDTTSLCTADCSSDDDCSDGQIRDKSNTSDKGCIKGFSCQVAQTVGDFCCRKLCVCKDFLIIPTGGIPAPSVCQSTAVNKANCQNIH